MTAGSCRCEPLTEFPSVCSLLFVELGEDDAACRAGGRVAVDGSVLAKSTGDKIHFPKTSDFGSCHVKLVIEG